MRYQVAANLLLLLGSVVAQDTGSVNTATITDATKAPETPSSVPSPTTAVDSVITPDTTQINPVQATAPGAQIISTSNAATVTTELLTTDIVKPTPMVAVAAQDLFQQIASDNPASVLKGSYTHFTSPINVASDYLGTTGKPIVTNNFYGNFHGGDGTLGIYSAPYTVFWSKSNYGLCAWNTDSTKYYFGSYSAESAPGPHYYYSPAGLCPIGVSAGEMTSSQTMTTSELGHQSVNVNFKPASGSGTMKIPLVQGNAFITTVYTGLTPTIFGGAFTSLTGVTFKAGVVPSGAAKYRVTINNGDSWLVYLYPSNGGSTTLTQTSTTLLTGPVGFNGIMQIAKLPANYAASDEAVYDASAGTYATQNVISGTASGNAATYTFNFGPATLSNNPLLSFLFPHQVTSISSGLQTTLKLWSNTKGLMQAYTGSALSFTEADLPTQIQFLPWSPLGNLQNYTAAALQKIAAAANAEAAQVMSTQTNLNSMYYSGKALAKFAQICLTLNDVIGGDATNCVTELQQNIAVFINNQNIYPLVYDTTWKGAISSCGDSGCDFGNAVYNDHHFHYGYFVYTAAVIAHIQPSWATGQNKAYINTLIRDFANPSTADTAFPQFRSFDWYAGHSWAHGITPTADGKDEESSSEDYNAIYGMKLWGRVIGDSSMEARGNLMLAVMRRSMQSYMLMSDSNTIQPSTFIHNKAAGITFMNKIDHTTYFGQAQQYIQGIHMIPLTPISAYIRTPAFVAEEWDTAIEPYLSGVNDGWLGILMANLGIANATAAYDFFASPSFSNNYLDGGASLTWYLTYAAGLGGAGNFQLAVNASNGGASTSIVAGPTGSISSSSKLPTTTSSSKLQTTTSSSKLQTTTTKVASSASSTSNYYSVSGSPINVELSATASSSDFVSQTQTATSDDAASTTSQASTSTDGPSVQVKLGAGNGNQISCRNGSLIVGNENDIITIYNNGTLSCGGLRAFLDTSASTIASTLYSIDLLLDPLLSTISSRFALNGSTLLLYGESSTLAKRQASTDATVPMTFVYGSDNVLMAIPAGQNTTLTAISPQAAIVVASSTSATVSSTTTASATLQSAGPEQTTTTSTTVTATLVSTTTVQVSSGTSVASSSGAVSPPSASDVPANNNGGSGASGDGTNTSGNTGSTGGNNVDASGNTLNGNVVSVATTLATITVGGAATAVPSVFDSTTIVYTTTVDGQANTLTTVVPIPTVDIVSTFTTTVCAQCVAPSVVAGNAPAASSQGAAAAGAAAQNNGGATTVSSTSGSSAAGSTDSGTSNTSASSAVNALAGTSSSGTSNNAASSSGTANAGTSNAASSNAGTSSSKSGSAGSAAQNGTMPVVSSLPISTSGASLKTTTTSLAGLVISAALVALAL